MRLTDINVKALLFGGQVGGCIRGTPLHGRTRTGVPRVGVTQRLLLEYGCGRAERETGGRQVLERRLKRLGRVSALQ